MAGNEEDMQKGLNYDQLLYLVEQAEDTETKIIKLLKDAENVPERQRTRYFNKIKELEAKISNI